MIRIFRLSNAHNTSYICRECGDECKTLICIASNQYELEFCIECFEEASKIIKLEKYKDIQ
ncbi:MAG: hypothetical protein LC122_02585 [Chitinophagales bacterium]|nr:hypothetical protein [Chitinophagales bacterium]